MTTRKPRVFIGSSGVGLLIAQQVQRDLDGHAECTLWSEGVFGLSGGTLESLAGARRRFDFAVLVLTPDDLVQRSVAQRNSSRDNVLFEIGLFTGALGRARTFIVHCRDASIDLPTDLAAVTVATFAQRADGDLQAALGHVCAQIRAAIAAVSAAPAGGLAGYPGTTTRILEDITTLGAELSPRSMSIQGRLEAVASQTQSRSPPGSPGQDAGELMFLQGIWKNIENGSLVCNRAFRGEIRCCYCFGGDDSLTGEYYQWKLLNGSLSARFRWFNENVSGYTHLRVVSPDRLEGGWWYDHHVPNDLIEKEKLPDVRGMHRSNWERQSSYPQPFPAWAEEFFRGLEAGDRGA